MRRARMIECFVSLMISLFLANVAARSAIAADPTASPTDKQSAADRRGPGFRPQPIALGIPSTLDLKQVDPVVYAKAFRNDPQRIFEFVRDQIRYEAYNGCLRGPRGTLLAMSGDSVDRATLLASLLRAARQTVRFARGTLPEAEAGTLVESMWADETTAPKPPREPRAEVKSFVEALRRGTVRDYNGIWDTLKRGNFAAIGSDFALKREALLGIARNHFWVQWLKDEQWIDLDPSFSEAMPGKAFAAAEATLDDLPDSLFHQVTLRVSVEEYSVLSTGNDPAAPVKREILSFTGHSADLSGIDLVFAHQSENWKGPVKGLTRAIADALSNTGKIKPVLITGPGKWIAGQPFSIKLPAKTGTGGLNSMLRGEGTRNPVALALAEFVDFEFTAPDGKKEKVSRDVFDLIGKAERANGKIVTADFVRDRAASPENIDLKRSLFDIFFTTGGIQASHLDGIKSGAPAKPMTVLSLLQCLNVTFVTGSDLLGSSIRWPDRSNICFYPDSPRVPIAEPTTAGKKRRLLLDLRRDHVSAAVNGSHPGDAFSARIVRGVLDGTLERIVVEYMTRAGREKKLLEPLVSASSVFERAAAEKVPSVLLSEGSHEMDSGIPADAAARLKEEFAAGFVAVAPKKPVSSATGGPRLAWWRFDPRSGGETAGTDQSLQRASTEREIVVVETGGGHVAGVGVCAGT